MTDMKQPEALRLAQFCRAIARGLRVKPYIEDLNAAAALLAHQYTEITELRMHPQEASYTSVQLAEMILSDCGCSTNDTSLLERVAKRIDRHSDTLPLPAPAAEPIDEYQRGRRAGITEFYDSLYAIDQDRARAALHKIEPQPAPASQAGAERCVRLRALLLNSFGLDVNESPQEVEQTDALFRNAARYQWLTDDHERQATRIVRNAICERLPVMSYSAASAAIDAAMAADKKGQS